MDRTSAQLYATETMIAQIREVYELYGFEALETPILNIRMCWEVLTGFRSSQCRGFRSKMMMNNGCLYAMI